MDFDDRLVVVTGAAGGIGRATVARFAEAGAQVVATDLPGTDFGPERDGVHRLEGDVTDPAHWEATVARAAEVAGGVDVCVNNAGVEGPVVPLVDYPDDLFDTVMAVNVKGVFLGTKHCAPSMAARGGGAIVNLSSVAGLGGTPGIIAYGASKHAVIGLTRTAALELAPLGIRTNAICPSPVDTPMMRALEEGNAPGAPEMARQAIEAAIPLGRYATPDEIAALIGFLCGPESVFMNGSIVPIDGGMKAR